MDLATPQSHPSFPQAATPAPARSILIHFGELGLKGRNQPMFRRQMRRNLRIRLRNLGLAWTVEENVGLFLVHVPPDCSETLAARVLDGLREVFGIVWLALARRVRAFRFAPESQGEDLAEIQKHAVELAVAQFSPGKTFAVRVNRGNKLLPFESPKLAAQLGQAIRDQTAWDKVDLNHPDTTFHLDLRCTETFLFGKRASGPGGLPVGTSGRVLALLSGGIDSPVAAYLMAKRGCRIDFVHFSAAPVTREEILASKLWRLATQLGRYTLRSRFYVVPYVHFDLALTRQKIQYELVLFRRFMVRVAARLAGQLRARALVTGDNLSQVASQTMTNLISASEASEMLVLRPLIGFDKEETIALAQRIGTYPISIEPYKDCCALIEGHPKTRSIPERLNRLERLAFPDYEQLIERTLVDGISLEIGSAKTLEALGTESARRAAPDAS